jgi:DNA-binding GntR family transcriptional regulator
MVGGIIMPKHKPSSTRERVYHKLREEILTLSLKPGANLSEKDISEKLQVSRTPVREAFLKLSEEGLLDIYPQKGTFVSLIDLELVEEAKFMREQLEIAVVKLACKDFLEDNLNALEVNLNMQEIYNKKQDDKNLYSLDEEFHRLIFQGCKKERIWLAIQPMYTHLNRTRVLRLATNYNGSDILSQHIDIFDAIKDRDSERAEKMMHVHLTLVIVDEKQLNRENPEYFK